MADGIVERGDGVRPNAGPLVQTIVQPSGRSTSVGYNFSRRCLLPPRAPVLLTRSVIDPKSTSKMLDAVAMTKQKLTARGEPRVRVDRPDAKEIPS